MKVYFVISHPARVHLYRNIIHELNQNNHEVVVFARDKDITITLLEQFDIPYTCCSHDLKSLGTITEHLLFELNVAKNCLRSKPDIMIGGMIIPFWAKIIRTKSIVFFDTDHFSRIKMMQTQFADRIYSPDCYRLDHGSNHILYTGYHELAYLHPNRFEPDPSVLDEAGLATDDRFVILRTVDWQALHDIGDSGFDDIVDVVTQLEATGAEVLITAEGELPDAVSHCQLDIEPHRIHDLMAYADLFVGESATMASESAVLGTPAVFVSSSRRGYTDELEDRYGLVFNFSDEDRHQAGLEKAIEILEDDKAEQWEQRRERLLEDKIDTTEFILDQITKLIH